MSKRTVILAGLALALVAAGIFVETQMGWSNVIGMLRYDTRREGDLKVGDPAPSFTVHETEQGRAVRYLEHPPERPVVLIFGSFT